MLHLQWAAALLESEIFVCVEEEQGKNKQRLRGFSPALTEPSHALQPSPAIHFETKQALNIYFQRSLPGGLHTSVDPFCNIIPTHSALYLEQIEYQKLFLITLCIPVSCSIGLVFLLCVLANQCTAVQCSTLCRFGTSLSCNALHIRA